jgi:hypothetical protein
MEKYKLSATVAKKYAPLINRSRMLHEQTPKVDFALYRERGASNIDLWCDGSIYPHHPVTNKRPNFRSVSDLLEFVGDGSCGLFGYIESLRDYDCTLQFHLQEAQREVQLLRDQNEVMMHNVNEKERLLQSTLSELQSLAQINVENHESLLAIEELKSEVNTLRAENERMLVSSESRMSSLTARLKEENDDRMQLELDLWVEIEALKESHEKSLSTCALELKRTKATLRRRDIRLQNLVKTPFGYRSIVRGRKDLSALAPKGGHTKRTLRLARSIILPATVKNIQTMNIESGSRQRLHGSKATQAQTGTILASLLSQTEVSVICEDPKLESVGVNMTNKYLNKIGERVRPCDVLETCDRNGITHNGYEAIYKRFKGAARVAGRGLRIGCLPNPHQVSLARSMLNLKLTEYVGEYYSLNETLVVPASAKATSKEPVKVCLNEMNSLFVDVEQVQRTMVQLYGLTPSGKLTL